MELNAVPLLSLLLTPAFPTVLTHSGGRCAPVRIVEGVFGLHPSAPLIVGLMILGVILILDVGSDEFRAVCRAAGLMALLILMAQWIVIHLI